MIDFGSPKLLKFVKGYRRQILISGLVFASSSVLLLSGCSSALTTGLQAVSGETVVSGLQGITHGGQPPVSGSHVQVYAVSAAGAGYNAAATPLGTPVTSSADGSWFYGAFSCVSGDDELYVVSSGGNPGLAPGTDNHALVMTAAIGPCSAVQAGTPSFVYVDEVTTVATAYALAGFSTDYLHVGTSSTNTIGLKNAFATFNNLVDVVTGQARTTTPAYVTPPASCATTPTSCTPYDNFRSIVPNDLINTLANVLAVCVNSDGTTACNNLFAITGGSLASPAVAVTNTADAALYIAQNPGLPQSANPALQNNVNLFNLILATGNPFGPQLSAAPNDYTMTVNYVGGGLGGVKASSQGAGTRVAIDQQGNVWVPNPQIHTVSELNNLGAPLSASTYINSTTVLKGVTSIGGYTGGAGAMVAPNYVAIDLSGNAWITDGGACLDALSPSGTPLSGSPFTSVCSTIGTTNGVAVDASNNIWLESASGTAINSVNLSGTVRSGFPVTAGFTVLDTFVGADYTGHMWFIDQGNGKYGALNTNGSLFAQTGSLLPYPTNGWVAMGSWTGSGGNSGLTMLITQADGVNNVQPALLTGNINSLPQALLPGTEASATGIASDGNSNYYLANFGGTNGPNTIPANLTVYKKNGSQISPISKGYTGGSALMALLNPNGVAIDQSGNVWVLNQNNFNQSGAAAAGGTYYGNGVNSANLTEFVGLAAPVNPISAANALNQTYGTKP